MSNRWSKACRDLWTLEPGVTFLNHGSYGATPKPVLAEQQRWRDQLEAQPVRFFGREFGPALRAAAEALAAFVGTPADRLVFVENATAGVNAVLRSLDLGRRRKILVTSHVYNAVRQTLNFLVDRQAASIVELPLVVPLADPSALAAMVEAALDEETGLVILDHVASASALRLPIEPIVAFCRQRGIPVLIDGAHAPGMLDLDVDAIGADWYVGNCHKWLCAPKGAAFLARRADAPPIHPSVISHFYGDSFAAEFDWVGTRDPSSWLAVPAAIRFHEELGGAELRRRNRALAIRWGEKIAAQLGTGLGGPVTALGSMATILLPIDGPANRQTAAVIHDRLWDEKRIEVPVMPLHDRFWLRISAQAYNDDDDYAALAVALRDLGIGSSSGTGAAPARTKSP